MTAGIIGVPLGSYLSTRLGKTYPRSDPVICAIGLLISAPLIAGSMLVITSNSTLAYILVFLGQLALNCNWAIVADMLLVRFFQCHPLSHLTPALYLFTFLLSFHVLTSCVKFFIFRLNLFYPRLDIILSFAEKKTIRIICFRSVCFYLRLAALIIFLIIESPHSRCIKRAGAGEMATHSLVLLPFMFCTIGRLVSRWTTFSFLFG